MILLLLPSLGFAQVVISDNGEIVAKGTANIILAGDWTNNASNAGFTASSGAGSVIFKGTSAQASGGSKYTIYKNASIDNTAGLVLGALTMFTDLTFINGIITSTSTSAIYIADGGSIIGAGSGKFINGPMAKIGDSDFKFEIGEGTKYAPIKVTSLSGSGTVNAVYYQSAPGNKTNLTAPLEKVSDVEYWILDDPDGGGGGFPGDPYLNAKIEIFWQNADESGIKSVDPTILRFAILNGSNWDPEAATVSGSLGTGNGSVASSSSFDLNTLNITFGSTDSDANPLPIQLLNFTAQCQEQNMQIEWSTASEENNDYFTILRSEDAEHYEEIGQIMGAGNSNEVLNYSFNDLNTSGEKFYYKLMQTDYDGKNETFSPIYANCDNSKKLSLQVLYDADEVYAVLKNSPIGSTYNMMIIDHTGRVIRQEKQKVNSQNYYRIPKQGLSAGLYSIIYFTNGNVRLNEKFFVQ